MAVGLAIQLEVALTADKADTVFDTTPVALALGAAALDRRLGRRGRQAVMAEPMTPDPAAG
jgi:hypothetical protein